MADLAIDILRIASHARWLTGPLFDKELRVASRRRKYYLLRFAYVCLLAVVVVHFWHSIVRGGGGSSAVAQVSRLGEAGKRVIVTIVWFQFLSAQILATVLLSDAISAETRRRTLEDLLVTPLRPIHVVLGKLLSRLLQIVLLLAISLPVLSVARVFGGVPWDYIVAGLCITLSASVFAGALSLLCSILYRHSYHAALMAGFWYLVLWGLDAFTLMVMPRTSYAGNAAGAFLWSLVSPLHALYVRTQMVVGGPLPANPCASLTLHCLTMLLAAGVILIISARRVRRLALIPTQGRIYAEPEFATTEPADLEAAMRRLSAEHPIRRVKGSPIVWKDLSAPWFRTPSQALLQVGLWLAVGGFVLTVVVVTRPTGYGSFFIPILIVQGVLLLRLGISAAGTVAREKEARTWPILLATPLDNGAIIRGKAIGVLRRNLPLMMTLLGLYLLAFLFGRPGERNLPYLVFCVGVPLASLLGFSVFLTGAGLYAGVRCRTTTGAMVSTFGTCACFLFLSSALCDMVLCLPGPRVMGNVLERVPLLVFAALGYGGFGLVFLGKSVRELRRNVLG